MTTLAAPTATPAGVARRGTFLGRLVRLGIGTSGIMGYLFLYAPILILVIFSFNSSRFVSDWESFSFRWYGELFRDAAMMAALKNSLIVAVISTTISTLIGTMAALVMERYQFGGKLAMDALLYLPKTSFELLGLMKEEPGVDLYSRKILIQKGSKEVMPEYLRFVKGVIDSEEIPLNISRETIQNNVRIDKIRKHVLKKLLEHLEGIKDKNREQYLGIWKNFSKNFKEGAVSDFDNRENLSQLLMFHSSKTTGDGLTDLKEYVGRMPEGQKEIYFLGGSDRSTVEKNPALEIFRKKDYEVLFLTDPLDEEGRAGLFFFAG